MELMDQFTKSNYSIEDLEQFRDQDGFIDLTKAGISFTENSREIMGNPNRVKNWVDFNGKKALIKGEAILDEQRNYGIYAELIVEEIAKKLGIETAHYDLIKMIDENGNTILGVLSESIVDSDKGERLETLHSIIGDEPEESEYPDITGYQYTIQKLREKLSLDGVDEEQIESVITEYKKRLVFSIATLDEDKHTENIAFVRKKVNGKEMIRLSSNFDSEASFLLDNDQDTVEVLLNDYQALQERVNVAEPRIATIVSKEEGGFGSLWMDTLDTLCEDDEIYDYYYNVLQKPLDMDEVLDNVEARIGTKLPENVRLLAKYSYQSRNEQMQKVMEGELLEEDTLDVNTFLRSLINRGIREGIRTGEQLNIGKKIQRDIQVKNVQIDEKSAKDEQQI